MKRYDMTYHPTSAPSREERLGSFSECLFLLCTQLHQSFPDEEIPSFPSRLVLGSSLEPRVIDERQKYDNCIFALLHALFHHHFQILISSFNGSHIAQAP